jgi:acetyltransferase-like isoleucine patch superfamily enzyme
MSKFITILFETILTPFLYAYERWIMYRIKAVWGNVHLNNIKNKGTNVKIVGYSRFLNPENLILGNNIRIGYNAFFYCKGGIEIGDNTIISRNVTIYSSNHNYQGNAIPYDNDYIHKKVKIGKGVWIGMGVMITPGVTIGDGAIIGMGTVVSRNVKTGDIIVGTGQKIVSKRDMEIFYSLEMKNQIFSKIWMDN